MQQLTDVCTGHQQLTLEDETFFSRGITGDESWVYDHDLEMSNHLSEKVQCHQDPKWLDKQQCQVHADWFLWHQGSCASRIHSCLPDSKFQLLLRCSATTVKMWGVTHVCSKQNSGCFTTTSLLTMRSFGQEQQCCCPPHSLFTGSGSLQLLSIPKIEDKAEKVPFWQYWGHPWRNTSGGWQLHQKGLLGASQQ